MKAGLAILILILAILGGGVAFLAAWEIPNWEPRLRIARDSRVSRGELETAEQNALALAGAYRRILDR